jgi:uncharacterized phage protein gp47/JayE
MYEHLTPEYIKSDILGELKLAEVREGSYTNTLISPVAHELWKVTQSLDAVISMVFPDETSGIYIDMNAVPYGIVRKAGEKARAHMVIHGVDGTVVEKGKAFLTAESLQYTLDSRVVLTNGIGNGTLTAVGIGERYNVAAGAIFRQSVNQTGINKVDSGAATGGADAETDAAYVTRYNEYRKRPPTSGNEAHYKQWATETDGVDSAKIYRLWAGPGTVKVLIVGPRKQPVDGTIVSKCAEHIETVRPIGATVSVMSAVGKAIDVSATVTTEPSTDLEIVSNTFELALMAYLEGIAFRDYAVVYNRIGYILLGIDGVTDFSKLTINGGAGDIVIGDDEVPVPGTIEVKQ